MSVLLLFLLLSGGGCSGGSSSVDGGAARSGVVEIVSANVASDAIDANGYLDVEAVISSGVEGEVSGLRLLLFASPASGGAEQLMAVGTISHLSYGEHSYNVTMEVSAYDADLELMVSDTYRDIRFELAATDLFEHALEPGSVTSDSKLQYLALGDAPVIVRNSVMIDIKEPPSATGFADATRVPVDESGWWRQEAGTVDGQPVVVAYSAIVDLRMELACASYDIAGFEITEEGGALIVGSFGEAPVRTYFWEGPFQDGEVGKSFTAMHWGDTVPPDISKMSFVIRPVAAVSAEGKSAPSERFAAVRVVDETLVLSRARAVPAKAAAVDLITYRDFVSVLWQLWEEYEIIPTASGYGSRWDTDVAPAYWFAKLQNDLSKQVDWSTATEVYAGLAGVNMKSDFFIGDRPINFWDSSRPVNQYIRIPEVYREASDAYNKLYNEAGTFPYGNATYMKWWATLPVWMMTERIFPIPTRSYGTLALGDMIGDNYLWQVAFPEFLRIVQAYGVSSYEYAFFWNHELGVKLAGSNIALSRPREFYRSLFPSAPPVPENGVGGGASGEMLEHLDFKPVNFEYGERDGADFIQYQNEIHYAKNLGSGSNKINAGYEFTYDDGMKMSVARSAPKALVDLSSWTHVDLKTPVWLFDKRFDVFVANAAFDSRVSKEATFDESAGTVTWAAGTPAEDSFVEANVEIFDMTLFDRRITFILSPEDPKDSVNDLKNNVFPIISKAFNQPLIDPNKAKVTVGPVEIGFGFGIDGQAGLNFEYRYGHLTDAADTDTVVYSKPVGVQIALNPNADLGCFAEVSVNVPLAAPLQVLKFKLGGEVTLVRVGLPLSLTRNIGFKAERLRMENTQPVPDIKGKWYYSVRSEKTYSLDFTLGGLDGELKLYVIPFGKTLTFSLYKWDGIKYMDDVNLLSSSHSLPLSIAAEKSATP